MTLAQLHIQEKLSIIGEPLTRLERKFRGRSRFRTEGTLSLIQGTF